MVCTPIPLACSPGEEAAFDAVLETLGHTFYDETSNQIYLDFMR